MNLEVEDKMLEEFYECFELGYDFEIFLIRFLEDLGFTDIKITKRSGDNGIDLICYKSVILDLEVNPEKYIVQAKRYKGKVPVKEIREFKGTAAHEKRIFITTSDFSKGGIEEAENDSYRKIILINGKKILKFYMEHPEKDYIFEWNPVISVEKVRKIVKNNSMKEDKKEEFRKNAVLRLISKNDIRARILPIPYEIYEKIANCEKYKVVVEGEEKILKINHERRYFGGVTDIYRKKKYLAYEGNEKKKSYWRIDKEASKVFIEFE